MKKLNLMDIIKKCGEIDLELTDITACFTGHRSQKLPWKFNENDPRCLNMKERLREEIQNAIDQGYRIFITGMALGFDMIAAEIVLEFKKKYKDIKLIAAIPCENQYERWPSDQQKRYHHILKKVDAKRCISETYTDTCMHERNDYMLNHSSKVIALYNGLPGGTGSTIRKAKEKGLDVVIIKP